MEGESVQEHRHYITEKICYMYMYFGSTHTVIYRPTIHMYLKPLCQVNVLGGGGVHIRIFVKHMYCKSCMDCTTTKLPLITHVRNFYCPLIVSCPYFCQLHVFFTPSPRFGMKGADNPVTSSTGSC